MLAIHSLARYVLAVALWLCQFSIQAQGQQQKQLQVVTSVEPYFIEQNAEGELSGYVIDFIRGLMNEASLSYEIAAKPWARVMYELQYDLNKLAFPVTRTAARESKFHWIAPIFKRQYGLYMLADRDMPKISRLDVFPKGLRVGVLRGDYRYQTLAAKGITQLLEFNSWEQVIGSLLKGRIDAMAFSTLGLQVYCQKMAIDCSRIKSVYVNQPSEGYLVLPRSEDNALLAEDISKAAEDFKLSREYQLLVKKWQQKYRQENVLDIHFKDGYLNLWPRSS